MRLLGGLWLARQLRTKATKPVSELLESKLRGLANKLNISKNVKLRESLAVKVPVGIGWLRPVILLPSSAITGLSVKQLELILAHELAHIHRHDYLVNLLQKIAETLLFYHLAVWWVSGAIRQERANCCMELFIEGGVHGRVMNHDFVVKESKGLIITESDYEPLDGRELWIDCPDIICAI
jgi:beta-lactamase regulating signal transducer with metallopeptidase domain